MSYLRGGLLPRPRRRLLLLLPRLLLFKGDISLHEPPFRQHRFVPRKRHWRGRADRLICKLGWRYLPLVPANAGLDLPLALKASYVADGGVDSAAVDWLMRGDLVALAFASVEHQRTKHWALAVGIEGVVSGQRYQPQRILLLDPSAPEPVVFQASNARLSLPQTGLGSRRAKSIESDKTSGPSRKPWLWRYESDSWNPETVHLLAAVRVRRTS